MAYKPENTPLHLLVTDKPLSRLVSEVGEESLPLYNKPYYNYPVENNKAPECSLASCGVPPNPLLYACLH
jgi:hypothetical protein